MSVNIGIDAIAFSTSKYFLSLKTLALHRNVDYAKYCEGIHQEKMSVFPPNEDIVTMAIHAAEKAISKIFDKDEIDLLIFATESSFDLSKSAGIYVHNFLGLKSDCIVFNITQACYSVTAGIRMARSFVAVNPNSKVLIIGADILKYSPGSSGEATQGGAAVAMIISGNPRMLSVEKHSGIHTEDVMDFWRPIESREAFFDGKLSAYNYLKSMEISFKKYMEKSQILSSEIDYACFHAPFGKMAIKAARQIFRGKSIADTLVYNNVIGNSGSASLYICLVSLLDNSIDNLSSRRIGFYSYGSGSVAEYFSGIVCAGYSNLLSSQENILMLTNRIEISFEEYEKFCLEKRVDYNSYENIGSVKLSGIENGRRVYEKSY
jgi:hydroxymethylglutaryl-CoA synthase